MFKNREKKQEEEQIEKVKVIVLGESRGYDCRELDQQRYKRRKRGVLLKSKRDKNNQK